MRIRAFYIMAMAALICAGPLSLTAQAESISIGSAELTGQSWEGVLDGGPVKGNGGYYKAPDPYGGSSYKGSGNNWGNYEGAGWLSTKWQKVTSSTDGNYVGEYMWINNFNVLEAIFGDPNNAEEVRLDTYNVQAGFDTLEVYLQSGNPTKIGLITEDERNAAISAGLVGALALNQIIFGAAGDPWHVSGTGRHGYMTLIGVMTLNGIDYDFEWTLWDFSNGQPSITSVLNHVTGKPQIHLDTGPGPETAVPEPASLLLLGSAAGVFAAARRRRRLAA